MSPGSRKGRSRDRDRRGGTGQDRTGSRTDGRTDRPSPARRTGSPRSPAPRPLPAAMTLAVFFGCTFIAFGPALGLCLFTVVRDPLRIIILIAGWGDQICMQYSRCGRTMDLYRGNIFSILLRAFFWLVSLLLSSLVWFIAVKASDPGDEPLQKGLLIFGVLFSVLLQEAFRFLYYKLLRKAIEGLVALSEDGCSPISIQQMAYAGLGFGLMSGAFSMINLLADALGPGTVGIHGDSQLYFLTSAFMTMVMIFLHTFWGILFFHGCETQRWWEMVAVIFTHLIVSGSTFWNPLYVGSLVPSYLLMFATAAWAYVLSGGCTRNLLRSLQAV